MNKQGRMSEQTLEKVFGGGDNYLYTDSEGRKHYHAKWSKNSIVEFMAQDYIGKIVDIICKKGGFIIYKIQKISIDELMTRCYAACAKPGEYLPKVNWPAGYGRCFEEVAEYNIHKRIA